ncbi:MAG: ABC transporter substrate-binding protein [Anaerotruncus sp.]|nr:ABC transporter substrate-binding protein [Anaerotruncus sp.]
MRKLRFLASVLALAMASTTLFTACGGSDEIKIGAIDPITGAQAVFGQDSLNGKMMAIEEINAKGGVLGKKLVLISEDDGAQAAQAATVATKLITQDKVVAIAGAHGSSSTLAVMEVLNKYHIPCVTPGSSSPTITSSGCAWISRGIPDDRLQSRILVKYAKEQDNLKKLGVLYSNDDYGKGGYDAAVKAGEEYGLEVVGESFMSDDQNFTTQISKLKDAGCDGVMLWCVYTPGSLICKQMRDMGWEPKRYASPGINNPQAFELSDGALDGVVNTTGFVAADPDEYVQDWIKRYEEKYKIAASQTAAVGYDSIMLIAEAIERAGSTDAEKVQEQIRSTKDFKSLKGILTINHETGEYEAEVRLTKANSSTNTFDFIASYTV